MSFSAVSAAYLFRKSELHFSCLFGIVFLQQSCCTVDLSYPLAHHAPSFYLLLVSLQCKSATPLTETDSELACSFLYTNASCTLSTSSFSLILFFFYISSLAFWSCSVSHGACTPVILRWLSHSFIFSSLFKSVSLFRLFSVSDRVRYCLMIERVFS